MKHIITLIIASLLIVSCGGVKVGIDDETLDNIEDAIEQYEEDYANANDPLIGTEDESGRYFLGTYSIFAYASCNDFYTFPPTVRLYRRDLQIDWEDGYGWLWTAELYADDTFDFVATYLDDIGNTEYISCSCAMNTSEIAYFFASDLECACSPPACTLGYNAL